MDPIVEINLGARYLYTGMVMPLKGFVIVNSGDPCAVAYQNGAIGFDFVKLIEVFLDTGEIASKFLAEEDTYYWGQELELADLEESDDYETMCDLTDATRFVLTSWGALIPLSSADHAIPYPAALELPLDMRLE